MAVLSEAVVLFLSAAAPTAGVSAAGVHKERSKTNGHVEVAGDVVVSASAPMAMFCWPVVLL